MALAQGHPRVCSGPLISESQNGGLGLRASQETGQPCAAHLHDPAHRAVQAQAHNSGHDEACEKDLPPVIAVEGAGDLPTGLGACLGQEDEQPEFAEHRRGGEWHSGHEISNAADLSEYQPNDQRARS